MAFEFEAERLAQLVTSGWRDYQAVDLISLEALQAAYRTVSVDNPSVWLTYKRKIALADRRQEVMTEEGMAATQGVTDVLRRTIYPHLTPRQRSPVESGFIGLLSRLAREELQRVDTPDLDRAWRFIETDAVASRLTTILSETTPAAWGREIGSTAVPPGLRDRYFRDYGEMYQALYHCPVLAGKRPADATWTLVALLQWRRTQ